MPPALLNRYQPSAYVCCSCSSAAWLRQPLQLTIKHSLVQQILSSYLLLNAVVGCVWPVYNRGAKGVEQPLSLPLSCRFDIMWLLLDESDEQQDARLAAHIINVHQGRVGSAAAQDGAGASSRQQAGASSSNSSGVSVIMRQCLLIFCDPGYWRTFILLQVPLLLKSLECGQCFESHVVRRYTPINKRHRQVMIMLAKGSCVHEPGAEMQQPYLRQVPNDGPIPPRLLRAYITLARRQQPTIPPELTDYISAHYVEARSQEAAELGERGAYITPRTLMSILRLSQVGGLWPRDCGQQSLTSVIVQ